MLTKVVQQKSVPHKVEVIHYKLVLLRYKENETQHARLKSFEVLQSDTRTSNELLQFLLEKLGKTVVWAELLEKGEVIAKYERVAVEVQ